VAGHAQHRDEEPAPGVGAVVAVLIVDHVSAGFPERLPGADDPLRLTFQLEEHFALQHVAEARSAVAVRRGARVAWWEFDEDGHHVEFFWDGGRPRLLQYGVRRLPGVGSWPVVGVRHGELSSATTCG